jgi:nicotinamide mononucleotide adenylyltransferase
MGSGSSVPTLAADRLPDKLDMETARKLCLDAFGEAYAGQFSSAVFLEHAVDGLLTRADFLKLVQTEANASLGDVWTTGGQDGHGPDSSASGRSGATEDASEAAATAVRSPRRKFSSEEQSLAKQTPLWKLVTGMKRLEGTERTPLVLVAIGKFNPVNLMHLHTFEVAKQYLERHTHYGVIGGYMCPMHDKLVRSACRGDVRQAIPGRRRLDMCQIATADSKWVDVGRWEIVQKTGHLDYPEILHRMSDLFKTFFQDHPNCADPGTKAVHTMYLCGGDDLVKCTPDNLREYGCVCIVRPGWIQKVADVFGEQWKGIVHVVEDTSVVDVALADLSSTKVRRLAKQKKDVENLVGTKVHGYMKKHKVLAKMLPSGPEEWTATDASMAQLKDIEIPPMATAAAVASGVATAEAAAAAAAAAATATTTSDGGSPSTDDASGSGAFSSSAGAGNGGGGSEGDNGADADTGANDNGAIPLNKEGVTPPARRRKPTFGL